MSMKTRDLEPGDKIWASRHIYDCNTEDYQVWTILTNDKLGEHQNAIQMVSSKETVGVIVSSYWEVCLVEDG